MSRQPISKCTTGFPIFFFSLLVCELDCAVTAVTLAQVIGSARANAAPHPAANNKQHSARLAERQYVVCIMLLYELDRLRRQDRMAMSAAFGISETARCNCISRFAMPCSDLSLP